VVWQDQRNGDWDIYGARISGATVSGPTPIYVGPGDQIHPAAQGEVVLWQSGALALATTTPQSYNRYDIVGQDLAAGQPITLTSGPLTHWNPAVDAAPGGRVAVWQSTVPTDSVQFTLTPGPAQPPQPTADHPHPAPGR
jgi:hypothetical protein